jgi:hypothetical protein
LVFEQKKNDVGLVEYDRLEKDIGLLDEQIEPVQVRYDKALDLAGVKICLWPCFAGIQGQYSCPSNYSI